MPCGCHARRADRPRKRPMRINKIAPTISLEMRGASASLLASRIESTNTVISYIATQAATAPTAQAIATENAVTCETLFSGTLASRAEDLRMRSEERRVGRD